MTCDDLEDYSKMYAFKRILLVRSYIPEFQNLCIASFMNKINYVASFQMQQLRVS